MAIVASLHVCHLVTSVRVGRLAVIVMRRVVHPEKLDFLVLTNAASVTGGQTASHGSVHAATTLAGW
ncbi:MAG TPA: hypothetical protein VGL34_10420 [Steroidobacteraceae bacterium]